MLRRYCLLLTLLLAVTLVAPVGAHAETTGQALPIPSDALPWWSWPILLFVFTLALGTVAVIGGVGGGVLFVPIVSAIFPFHFDFIRGTGLIVALCGALAAAPRLLRARLASIRLAIPLAVSASAGSIGGAMLGLALPTSIVQSLLGVVILGIVALMLVAKPGGSVSDAPATGLAATLGVSGDYLDQNDGRMVAWAAQRLPAAIVVFAFIGVLAGMFGLGAGWANVPAMTLLAGVPIKLAVGTSGFIITMTAPAAGWVYVTSGAVIPFIAVPSVVGMMLGTRIGAALLPKIKAEVVRWAVIVMLVVAGARSAMVGLGGLFG